MALGCHWDRASKRSINGCPWISLLNRGHSYSSLENHQAVIKDCTQLINLPDVSVSLTASALWTRGRSYSSLGGIEGAMQDDTRLNSPMHLSSWWLRPYWLVQVLIHCRKTTTLGFKIVNNLLSYPMFLMNLPLKLCYY